MFKHQDLHIFGPQIKQIWKIFTHLNFWVAVASQNFKWVNFFFFLLQRFKGYLNVCLEYDIQLTI